MTRNILENASPAQRLALRRQLAAWSDGAQKRAATFAEQNRELLGRRIGGAQLSGLNNIAQSAPWFEDLKQFARHQGDKAERAGHYDVQEYWAAMRKQFEGLEPEAWQLGERAGLALPAGNSPVRESKEAMNEVYLMLAREWVQHLWAHSLLVGRY